MPRGFRLFKSSTKPLSQRWANRNAPALTDDDIENAALDLRVDVDHIRMLLKVESNGKSFDPVGRPVILYEPHIFHRLTKGRWSPTSYSYTPWGLHPYPSTFEARWRLLEAAAVHDSEAALESASYGLFQIMGFHWEGLGYNSVHHFVQQMHKGELEQLEALVRFIQVNKLDGKLRQCDSDPENCRAFARAYNGPGYSRNRYHERMAKALA
jgi:hypothetical protein